MARLTILFERNWLYKMKTWTSHATTPTPFSFDVEATNVREALFRALKSHSACVAPLFNEKGELEFPAVVSLWLHKDGSEVGVGGTWMSQELQQMLNLPLQDGWYLRVHWGVRPDLC